MDKTRWEYGHLLPRERRKLGAHRKYLPVSLNPTAWPEAVALYRRRMRRYMRKEP